MRPIYTFSSLWLIVPCFVYCSCVLHLCDMFIPLFCPLSYLFCYWKNFAHLPYVFISNSVSSHLFKYSQYVYMSATFIFCLLLLVSAAISIAYVNISLSAALYTVVLVVSIYFFIQSGLSIPQFFQWSLITHSILHLNCYCQ